MIYIRFPYPSGSEWLGPCSETQMILSSSPALFHISCWWISFQTVPFRYFAQFLQVTFILCLGDILHLSRGLMRAALRRGLLLPTQKGWGWGLHFLYADKTMNPFPTQLSLFKDANTPEDKREGMGIVKIWILGNNLSQRVFHLSLTHMAVLGRVHVRCRENVVGMRVPSSSCYKKHTDIIYNFPLKRSTLSQLISVFPMPCFPQSAVKPYTKFIPNFRDKIGSLWARSIM